MEIFFYSAVVYILAVFVLSRFIIPHSGFEEEKIPEKLPETMLEKIREIKSRASDAERFLNLTYDYLGEKYRSERFNTIFKFHYLFKSLDQAWQMSGFMPCTISNYFLKIFLVKSGWFEETDIRRRYVFVNFVPHQYLKVKINDKWLDIDVGENNEACRLANI
jgi:hypothetical protein